MKIAVIGGHGLIGSRVVGILNAEGHDAAPHSLSTGVDLRTGEGLPEAVKGADVVVNLTRPRVFDHTALVFYRETMENLLVAAEDAGVGHLAILSVVGADRVRDVVFYRAKALQEEILRGGPVPYSIVRSTQFFEFLDTVMSWTADAGTVRLPATLMQPIAAADVARTVAAVAVTGPLDGVREIAGPEVFALDELGRLLLAARGDKRAVVTDADAGLYSFARGRALLASDDTPRAETTYGQWLARGGVSVPSR